MDWIEQHLEKWRKKLKNYSLWKSLAVYLIIGLIITIIAVAFTFQVCNSWQTIILKVNGITDEYRYLGNGEFAFYPRFARYDISLAQQIKELGASDYKLYNALDVAKNVCIPIYSAGAILLVSFLYYRNKLKEPIFLLEQEMLAIRRDDLSFSCHYESDDEMGEICDVMDKMRLSMQQSRQNMLEMMEEQRKINAAFAHDLRTPLTVINGYVEMLSDYYDKGQLDEAQIEKMLFAISNQTKRMQAFSDSMKDVQGFEMLKTERVKHDKNELESEIESVVNGVKTDSGLAIKVSVKMDEMDLVYDENVVMEVLGNLLSNAVRYAKKQIEVVAEYQREHLYIYVKDDGRGMTKEELYKADSPYFSDKTGGDSEENAHFGLGLTICKILCKKHGGKLTFSNSIDGGAIVCGQFFVG